MGGEGGRRIIQEAVEEISQMDGLKHINFNKYQSKLASAADSAAGSAADATVAAGTAAV